MITAPSNVLDLTPIINPILSVVGLIIAGLLTSYVPKLITAFEARTGIHLTDQQRTTIEGSVKTAAGEVETLIDQGVLHVSQVHVSDPTVLARARAAIDAAPAAAAALGISESDMARLVVGAVDTATHNAPAAGAKTLPGPSVWMQGTELKPAPAPEPAPAPAPVPAPAPAPAAPPPA